MTTLDQKYPAISGTKVVWQDDRNGNWDIYLYDGMTGATSRLTDDPNDQERPADRWPLRRLGGLPEQREPEDNPDIYLLDLDTGVEMKVNIHDSLSGGYDPPAIRR